MTKSGVYMDISMLRLLSLRRFALIGGTSASAMGIAMASPAMAQCAPDPTVINGTATCTGVDADGLIVTSTGTVIVASGARVGNAAGHAGAIALSGSPSTTTLVTLTNTGAISSTTNAALGVQNNPQRVGFSSIVNTAGASIVGSNGAINAVFERLTNAGLIDGGAGSAITFANAGGTVLIPASVSNSGSIVSNSTAATIAFPFGPPQQFANSGRIVNSGTGLAVDAGSQTLNLVNQAGGVIGTSGPIALRSTFQVALTNAGTINGGIVGGSGFDDLIDTRAGIIYGSVSLNGGNDRLITAIGATTLVGNITGAVDGGAGTDLLELVVGQNRVLTDPTLPTNFEVLQLDLGNNAMLTLSAQPPAGGYHIRGTGTVVVGTDFTTAGPAIGGSYVAQNVGTEALRFVNDRSITATLAQSSDYAVALRDVVSATNSGTITAIGGNGVSLSGTVGNSGTIVATNTAVTVSGQFNNSGTIRSTNGVAVSNDLGGGLVRSVTSTNSGVIQSSTLGYSVGSIILANSGTISATNGDGVVLSSYSMLDNRAGGVISGTRAAVRGANIANTYVVNAGTINGDVIFSGFNSPSTPNVYVAQTGGMLNGNLTLSIGDVLITDLVNTGTGTFAGISGTVNATNAELRYRVRGTVSATLAPVGPFQQVGYDLVGGAKLTLTAPATRTQTLTLTGSGTVDLNATIATTNAPTLQDSPIPIPGLTDTATTGLAITSRGALSYTRTSSSAGLSAVSLGANDSFTNAGTISITDTTAQSTPYTVAIVGGASVINTGSINVQNGIGVGSNGFLTAGAARTLTNSGSITQNGGTVASIGVNGVGSVINSGTISVQGVAIASPTTVVNSGSIVSTGGIAITSDYGPTITNLAGGTIRGGTGQLAIRAGYGTLTNAGTIIGNVNLGYQTYGGVAAFGASYVAAGGTLTGNLLFGSADDTLIINGATNGVSGTIDGGAGLDTIVLDRTGGGAGSFAGATNFERLAVNTGAWTLSGTQTYASGVSIASGASAILTTATFGGDIVNNGTLTSALSTTLASTATSLSITNAGTISDTNATGRAINLVGSNNARTIVITNAAGGLISSADDAVRVNYNPTGGSIRLDNAGTIQTTNGGQALDFDAAASGSATIVINNAATGIIRSFGQDAIRPGQGAVVTNAGLIFSDGAPNNSYDGIDWQGRSGVVLNQATGTISGLRHGITSDVDVNVTNAGLILGRNGSGVGSDGTGTVVNTGTITGQWDGVATNGDGDGVDIDLIGSVTNSGIIQGLSATGVDSGGRPNSAEGIAMGGGTIVNTAGALVFGAGNAILINHDTNAGGVADGATTITNSGTIRAGSGYAISLVGTFDDTIVNAGTITGGTAGAIDMGAGNDTLALLPGSVITGTVDGGAGLDRVVLGGTGSGSFAGAVNFETLAVASGNWTLTAPATFVGGTGIAAGASLTGTSATLTGSIADAGTLTFNQSTDGTVAATLSGNGQLVKTGTGALTIGNQSFTGTTLVNAGRLVLAGTLPSAVTVTNGGTLAGNGTVASLALASGGTVAPGNSPGTIVVTGNFTQASGAIYAAEVTAAGASDRITVGGTATLASGALLSVTRDAGTFRIGQRYTLLTAAGGIIGTYTLVQTPVGGTEFRLVQTANGIAVDLARTGASLATLAQTGNQAAVAGSFGSIGVGNAAYATLTLNPDDAAVRTAFDSLSGEVHASLRTAMLKDAQAGEDAVRSRSVSRAIGNGVWGQVNGLFGTDAATRDAAAVDRRGWGIFGGVDAAIGAHARAGLAGGYTRTTLDVDARASHATIETKQVLVYAGGTLGPVVLRASVGYAWSDDTSRRSVGFTDYAATHAAKYSGATLHGVFEAGITQPLLRGTVEPYVGVEAYRVHSDGFAESGNTATALVGQAKSETFTLSNLGLRADTPIVNGISARTQLGWRHIIGDARPSATLQFAGSTLPFTVTGAGLSRDSATMALDLEWKPVDRLSIIAGYAGAIGGNGAEDNRLRLSASLSF